MIPVPDLANHYKLLPNYSTKVNRFLIETNNFGYKFPIIQLEPEASNSEQINKKSETLGNKKDGYLQSKHACIPLYAHVYI